MTASVRTGFLWGDKMKMSYTGDAAELCNREYTQAQSCVCKWGNGIIRIILQDLANKAPCKFRNHWNKGGEWEKKMKLNQIGTLQGTVSPLQALHPHIQPRMQLRYSVLGVAPVPDIQVPPYHHNNYLHSTYVTVGI